MKKDCGCSEYDKCEHEIAEAGAAPKEAESKDGKQEKVDVEKKDRCWDGYEPVPGKKPYEKGSCAPIKKHEEVIDNIMKSWDGPESPCTCGADGLNKAEKPFKGYNPEKHAKTGGLNDKYREKYNRENGSHLQRPSKDKENSRHKSFCARMKGVKGPTSEGGKLTPKGAALKRWACSKSDLGKSYNEIRKEESKAPTLNGPRKEPSEPMKRLKPGVSPTGMPVLSGSAKDIVDVLRHHAGAPKAGPAKKDPFMERISQMAMEIAKEYAEKGKLGFKKSQGELKPDLSRWHDTETSPSGKKYKDMGLEELDNHILNLWADLSDHFRTTPLKRPDSIKINGPKASETSKETGMKKSDGQDMEKGIKDLINRIKPSSKKPTGMSPEGKRYEDMTHEELKAHMTRLFDSHHDASEKPKGHSDLVASEAGKESLDKGDIIDMKTKAKTPGQKPAAPAKKPEKKPDTRSRDQKIKDALASQGEKGSPYAETRASQGAGAHNAAPKPKFPSNTKPAEPKKPGIHAGMSRQELMDQVNRSPEPAGLDRVRSSLNNINRLMSELHAANNKNKNPGGEGTKKPSEPSHLKVIKSLEAMAPSMTSGMSLTELKKAEEQYSMMLSKVEQVLAKGDAEAIRVALEKIKGDDK